MSRPVHLIVAIALLSACGGERAPTETAARLQAPPTVSAQSSAMEQGRVSTLAEDLETLRRVTAPFHDFNKAVSAGWSAQITPCMVDPAGSGGMGFHYGNTALFDATVRVDQPELLLYEPRRDGRLRLVAVEYIVPYTAHSRDAAPPVLFGQKFLQNDTFQLWGLHVWIWKQNPSGLFANWNPRVSCSETHDVAAMAH